MMTVGPAALIWLSVPFPVERVDSKEHYSRWHSSGTFGLAVHFFRQMAADAYYSSKDFSFPKLTRQ